MIIQHNLMALNSYNRLSTNNSAVQKNLEKLSSGYRINKAGDDAAGLAISEKMRAQITGLERAKSNAQDGISLVQTAEGALTEVHSMLNRLVELSVQSSNGIYQEDDRQKIQDEVNQTLEEIDRISEATNFNGIKLLDGSLGSSGAKGVAVDVKYNKLSAYAGALTLTSSTKTKISVGGTAGGATALDTTEWAKVSNRGSTQTITIKYEENGKNGGEITVSFQMGGSVSATQANLINALQASKLGKDFNFSTSVNGAGGTPGVPASYGQFSMEAKNSGNDGFKIHEVRQNLISGKDALKDQPAGTAFTIDSTAGEDAFYTLKTVGTSALGGGTAYTGAANQNIDDYVFEINGQKFAFVTAAGATAMTDKSVNTIEIKNPLNISVADADDAAAMAKMIREKTGIDAQVKANSTSIELKAGVKPASKGDGLTLQIGDTSDDFNKVTVSVDDMSVKGLGIDNLDVSEQGISSKSIDKIKDAIEKVSTNRGRLGALQNRLEHTISNLAVTTENMTAAESRIRDTDMAKEMMQFTKNNVLVQAAQSMLAQANQQPQQVLQLLR